MKHEEYDTILASSELPYECKLIYCYLRRHMDYATGVVGGERGLSYHYIWMYALEYNPKPTSNEVGPAFCRHKMKRWLKRLVDAGFIVPMHDRKLRQGMVFFLPLACPGKGPSAGSALDARHKSAPLCISAESHEKTEAYPRSGSKARSIKTGGARHVSVNTEYMNTSGYTARARDVSGETPIPDSWEPDDLLIRELQREFRLREQVLREQGVFFRMRAKERGYVRRCWRDGFRQWVRRGVQEGFAEYQRSIDD